MTKRICSIDGCDRQADVPGAARGWCSAHYQRWQRYGDPSGHPGPKPDRGCRVSGCDSAHDAHGYCSAHRARLARYGDPLASAPEKTLADRFWAKVEKRGPGGCWEWTAYRDPHGYGRISVGGAQGGMQLASRVAWELEHRSPVGCGHVCHRCDNPPCVNPAHLFLGDPATNSADMVAKHRQMHGGRHVNAKLTEELVLQLRAEYAAGGISQRALAAAHGVSQSALGNALRGKTWKHV